MARSNIIIMFLNVPTRLPGREKRNSLLGLEINRSDTWRILQQKCQQYVACRKLSNNFMATQQWMFFPLYSSSSSSWSWTVNHQQFPIIKQHWSNMNHQHRVFLHYHHYCFLVFPYHHRSCLAIAPGFGATPFEGRRPGDPVATPRAEQDGGSLVTRSEAAEVDGPCSQICFSGTAVDSCLVYHGVQKFLVVQCLFVIAPLCSNVWFPFLLKTLRKTARKSCEMMWRDRVDIHQAEGHLIGTSSRNALQRLNGYETEMAQTVWNIVEAHPLINVSSDFVVKHPQQDRCRLTRKRGYLMSHVALACPSKLGAYTSLTYFDTL